MKMDIKERYFSNLFANILSGLTTGIVALPMAMAFGVASGLGAHAGIYGAMATGIFAALFGGTPGQVTGPTGPMTVVVATIVASHLKYPELIFAVVALAGVIQILFGLIKTGQFIRYVPYPVISGFMSGIGIIIILIQIGPLFGLEGYGDIEGAIIHFPDILVKFNTHAALIGILSILIIYSSPFITKKIPSPLVALFICTTVSVYLNLDLPRIGEIPQGFPSLKLPEISSRILIELPSVVNIHLLFTSAFTLAILGSIDSLLTSLVVERITGKRHNSDQEQIGQGIGNIVAGLIGGIPGAGATMRSLVNVRAGGTSHLGGIIHGLFLLAILISIGPLASVVPLSCLAGILITVGIGILDYKGLKSIGKAPKDDAIVMLMVLTLTVFVDLIIAVIAGVALSSILFAKKVSDVNVTHSSFDSLEHLYEVERQIPVDLRKKIYTYTFSGPIFFGEVKNFDIAITKMQDAKYLIIKFYNVHIVDQSGAYAIEEAIKQLKRHGVKVLFVGMTPVIKSFLTKLGSIDMVTEKYCFDSFEDALSYITKKSISSTTRS